MKTHSTPIRITALLSAIAAMLIFYSCNSLHGDPDLIKKSGNEVYVTASGASVIDLSARIKNQSATSIAIFSQPMLGTVAPLGKSLVQYKPNTLKQSQRDAFVFKAFDKNQVLLETDTVVVVVENDSTQLPCGIYANPDYPDSLVTPGKVVSIQVLKNDIICAADSDDFVLSILSGPRAGTAIISDNKYLIYYAPQVLPQFDSIVYKIQSTTNPSHYAYGIVLLMMEQPCAWTPSDDYYLFHLDSIHTYLPSDTLSLSVGLNDQLCNPITDYTLTIVKPFPNGYTENAWATHNAIWYLPDPLVPGGNRMDTLEYRMCKGSECHDSWVVVYLKH